MSDFSRKDEIISCLAVAILLIGTATNNAKSMLVISAITMLLMAVFYRARLKKGVLLIAMIAAVTAFVIGLVLAMNGYLSLN